MNSDWLLGYAVRYTHTANRPSVVPSSRSIHRTLVSRAVPGQQSRLHIAYKTDSRDTPGYIHTHGKQAISDAFIQYHVPSTDSNHAYTSHLKPIPGIRRDIYTHMANRPSVMPSSRSIHRTLVSVAVPGQQSRLHIASKTDSRDTPGYIHTHGKQAISDAFIQDDPSYFSMT
ncbi:hypothetical protein J6590_070724 [Homalodisca vitripennis]|nr:hypothetical protein J6590_070724 [Homalodisca vitripennis]